MKLREALTRYTAALRRKRRAQRTIDVYTAWLDSLAQATGDPDIETITLDQLRAWSDSLVNRNLATNTLRNAAMTAKIFFKWCLYEQIIPANPADRLELPAASKRAPDALSTNDLLTLINDLTTHSRNRERDTALIVFMSESGCRVDEILTLQPAEMHIEEQYAIVTGKGNKQRWVYFGEASQACLRDWQPLRPAAAPNLFDISQSAVREVLRRLSQRTGIKLHPHKLRRSAATLRAAKGMTAPALQQSFGWKDLETAERYVAAARTREQAHSSNPLDGVPLPRSTN